MAFGNLKRGEYAAIMLAFFYFMNYMAWLKNYSTKNIVEKINGVWEFEMWRSIEETEYLISSFGRVKIKRHVNLNGTVRPEKIRKLALCGRYLRLPSSKKTYSIHRLVCSAFHENHENKPQVNHKDTIKWNNFYLNVEWSTQSENIVHAQHAGIYPFAKPKPPLKKKEEKLSGGSNPKIVIDINTGIFYTTHELAALYNTTPKAICRILCEERKPNTTQYRYA